MSKKEKKYKKKPQYLIKQIKKFNELLALCKVREDDTAFKIFYWFLEESGYEPSYYLAEIDSNDDFEMMVIKSDEEHYEFVQFNTI